MNKVLRKRSKRILSVAIAVGVLLGSLPLRAFARDVEYKQGEGEVEVWVNVGEPTEISFPSAIKDGFRNSNAGISLEKKETSIIVFGKDDIKDVGEAILVRLQDGRSFPLRIKRATVDNPRDGQVMIGDGKAVLGGEDEGEDPPYSDRSYEQAPPSKVAGLMREMILVSEFGKGKISGYQVSEKFKGETVISDGAVLAKIDKIFTGPNLWGYVLDATNLLDQTQRINPATFRIDGTRAVSISNGELSPRPLNVEEQVAGKHNTKVYVVTRAR
jgi:hypothetical protein